MINLNPKRLFNKSEQSSIKSSNSRRDQFSVLFELENYNSLYELRFNQSFYDKILTTIFGTPFKEDYGIAIHGLTTLVKYKKIKDAKNNETYSKEWEIKTSEYPITYLLYDETQPLQGTSDGRNLFHVINITNARSDLEKILSEKNLDTDGYRSTILNNLFEKMKQQIREKYKLKLTYTP